MLSASCLCRCGSRVFDVYFASVVARWIAIRKELSDEEFAGFKVNIFLPFLASFPGLVRRFIVCRWCAIGHIYGNGIRLRLVPFTRLFITGFCVSILKP